MRPIYEFLLWDNCKNGCAFCPQRKNPNNLSMEQQIDSMSEVINFITSDKFIIGSDILIVGGELFDSPRPFLLDFFKQIKSLIDDKIINKILISTNLLYGDPQLYFLLECLNIIGKDNLYITTSYDIEGRFKNNGQVEQFYKNLDTVSSIYATTVNTILTKKVCQQIVEDKFILEPFYKKNLQINLLPYIIYNPSLAANKNDIFSALAYLDCKYENYIQCYIKRMDDKRIRHLYKYVDGGLKYSSCSMLDCGHSENLKKYSVDNTCFICDVKRLFNVQ